MGILDIAIIIFIVLEALNVIIIYTKPEFKYGNGMSPFRQWEELKKSQATKLFARYMANWVAGSKVIFIALLLAILLTAGEQTKLYAVIAMIPAIALYYIKLHPIIKELDGMDEIIPKGYSKVLCIMITVFVAIFGVAAILHILL